MLHPRRFTRLAPAILAGIAILQVPAPSVGEQPLERPGDPYVPAPALATSPSAEPRLGTATSVQVNVNGAGANILGDAANEPTLAVDPTNPNRMTIGWRQFDTVASNFRQAGWAYSQDAGRTWHFPGVLDPGHFRSDPVMSVDASGNFYYGNLYVVGSDFTFNVYKSTNGGVSWGSPAYAFGGDKEWMTIDRTAGIGRGHVYGTWATTGSCCGTNTFTRSTNGGTTFPQALNLPQNPQWGTMDVAPDGALYVAGVESGVYSHTFVVRSSNAQNRLMLPVFESIHDVNLGGSVSSFGGSSSPNPDGLLGQLWIAADHSTGPTAGWLYVVCSVDPPGTDPLDVMFSRSTDRGVTWSAPVRLNDDAPGSAWQWFATMSVAPNGRIDVVWNDTRNTGAANRSELYYRTSSDGGTTWSANQRLSPAWDSHVGWPNQNKIGDYYHMVSDDMGANLAWSATFNGEQDVWFLRIGDYDCNANGIGDSIDIASGTSTDWNYNGIPDECEGLQVSDTNVLPARFRLLQNAPNPFNPTTSIGFEVPAGVERVQLQVYDVAGRAVRTLGRAVTAGRNVILWDGLDERGAPAGSGIYLYRLEAPGFAAARRMVLVR